MCQIADFETSDHIIVVKVTFFVAQVNLMSISLELCDSCTLDILVIFPENFTVFFKVKTVAQVCMGCFEMLS